MAMMDFVRSHIPGGRSNGHDAHEAEAMKEEVTRDASDEEEERLHRILVEARDETGPTKKGSSIGGRVSGAVGGAMSGAGGALMGLARRKKKEGPSDGLIEEPVEGRTTPEEEEAIREGSPAFGRGTVGVAEGSPEEPFVRGRHEWERRKEGPQEADFEYDEASAGDRGRIAAAQAREYEDLLDRALVALKVTHPDDPAHAQAFAMMNSAENQTGRGAVTEQRPRGRFLKNLDVAIPMMRQAVTILEDYLEQEPRSEPLRDTEGVSAEQFLRRQGDRVRMVGSKGIAQAKEAVSGIRERRREDAAATQAHVDQEIATWIHYRARALVVKEHELVLSPSDRKVLTQAVLQGIPLVGSKEASVQTETATGHMVTTKQIQPYAKSILELQVDIRKGKIEESELKRKIWDERMERIKPVAAMAGRLVEMGKVETKMGFPSPTGPAVPARVYASGMMPSGGMPAAQAMVGGMSKMRQVAAPRSPAASMIPVPQTRALSVLPTRRIRR